VDVVGIDRTTDYALVVTQDKKRGWLPASSLTTTAPATPVLVQPAAADSPSPTIPNNETPAEVSHTSSQPTTTDKNAAAVIADTAPTPAATAALDPSKSHYTDVKEKLNALASANAATPNTIVKLTPQEMINYTAIQRENRAWFISGAGILILGMFVGLIVSKIAFRRRRSSWD
jgi:SH3 domain protein